MGRTYHVRELVRGHFQRRNSPFPDKLTSYYIAHMYRDIFIFKKNSYICTALLNGTCHLRLSGNA